jgi:hypothetical protein
MKHVMSRFSHAFGLVFNWQVAQAMTANGFSVRTQVKKFGKVRMLDGGNDLGDIDVLAIDAYRKRLWILECKNFASARVAHEIKNDLEDLFVGSERKISIQSKHQNRIDWVNAHLTQVLAHLGESLQGSWTVRGGFVLSQPLVSPLLGCASMPYWTLNEIEGGRGPGLASRPRVARR